MRIGLKNHIPTFSSITTVRTSPRDKTLSSKTDATISTIARFHMDSCFIHKFHFLSQAKWRELPCTLRGQG